MIAEVASTALCEGMSMRCIARPAGRSSNMATRFTSGKRVLDKKRLLRRRGDLTPATMKRANEAIRIAFDPD